MEANVQRSTPPRSLLAVCACAFTSMLTVGSVCTMGVYYDSIRTTFKTSHFATAFLFSLTQFSLQVAGLIVGFLLKFVSESQLIMAGGALAATGLGLAWVVEGYPQLVIAIGLLNGLGEGLAYVTGYIAASFIFNVNRHHIAMSLTNSGGGVGMFIYPLLYEFLIEKYSWRGSFLVAAGLALQLCVCGALLRTPSMSRNRRAMERISDGDSNPPRRICNRDLWTEPTFYLLVLNTFCYCFGYSITFTYLYPHLLQRGVPKRSAALVFSAYGVASMLGRLSASLFNNRRLLKRWTVYALAHFTLSLGILLLASLHDVPTYCYVFPVLLMGLGNGLQDTLLCCVCLDVLGPEKLADGFSLLVASWGFGSLTGATVGGLISDQFVQYSVPITFAALCNMIAAAVLLPLRFVNKYCDVHGGCLGRQSLGDGAVPGSLLEMHDRTASANSLLRQRHMPRESTPRSL